LHNGPNILGKFDRLVTSMPESIDDLYARWQANPSDPSQTVRICEALRRSNRSDLVSIVGEQAARQLDTQALLAAARMYSDAGRLDDAQSVLVSAGRLAPRDGDVYRWLGEVLLRRGDAERAEKVLERAMHFGGTDPDASRWLERARALLPTQRSHGMAAVAQEVGRTRAAAVEEDEMATQVRSGADVRVGLSGGRLPPPAAPPPREEPPLPSFGMFGDGVAVGGQTGGMAQAPVAAPPAAAAGTPFSNPFAAPQPPPVPAPQPPPAVPAAPPMNPLLAAAVAKPLPPDGKRLPEARDVLEALQIAGIYEPDGAVRPHQFDWDKPKAGKRRIGSYATVVTLVAVIVGGVFGTYHYVTDKRKKQHLEAEAILAKLDADLQTSEAARLEPAEKSLTRVFDLETRSPHAALTWLHERAMVGLVKSGENVAFEDAAQRAKEVGIDEKRIAFAYVASFLFQNDTAGAASTVAKWDGKADDDPWYQLLAGATFERAGDARAVERYAAAVRLDPDLVIARILLARATAVDGDPGKALELAKELRAKYPTRPEGAALVALAWSRDPRRGEPPPEVKEVVDKTDLPAPLRAVPHAARALLALEQHKVDDAKAELRRGLGAADTPGIAAWLGSIALSTGDEALARKAALDALSYSALYPPARVLAARVALLGGRLDEALKAAEELPPASPDVAAVTAAASYEKVDAERMQRALDALSDDAKKLPFLTGVMRGQALLAGNPAAIVTGDKALELAADDAPWSDLIAMDVALDSGDADTAGKIAAQWKDDVRPLRALRLARFARYEGKLEDADKLSAIALTGGSVPTVRAFAERIFTLVAEKKEPEAVALFKKYPNVGGADAKWLRAYAVASGGKVEEARAIVSQEDPPPPLAPLPVRLYAAAAYGAMKETRHGNEYVKALAKTGFVNPDLLAAAEKVGAGKLATGRRR
jgi:predicted Zn-dependent protease